MTDPNSSKYVIQARITANGVVERSDVVGAIFGQTEGLLGNELDLRDMQKSGRMGRIEVDIKSSKGHDFPNWREEEAQTDPWDADSDDDGMSDGYEADN